MAMLRYGSASIVKPEVKSDSWVSHYSKACSGDKCRMKTARSTLAKYDPNKFLLTHCTIIAAVDVEEHKDWLIKPEYSQFINNNGDAWTKDLLAKTYRTFIGANNYLEHVQIPELSKGKVIDAILREVPIGVDKKGKELTTYYVDILVATNREHKDLVNKISSGKLNTLSMGCVISYSICSKCGNKAVDESQACRHVKFEKNNTFFDERGVQRKVAELCGHKSEEDSVKFIDASWVATPAFTGAVLRNIVQPSVEIMQKLEDADKTAANKLQELDFLKVAASEDTPSDSPENAQDDLNEDGQPEVMDPDESEGDQEEEVSEELDIEGWKQSLKNRILEEIGNEVFDDIAGKEDKERPIELETLDDTILKPTAKKKKFLNALWEANKVWSYYIDKTVKLPLKDRNKLKVGSYILFNSDDSLSDYGYSRRDFLAVMSYLEGLRGKRSLPKKLARTIHRINELESMRDSSRLASPKRDVLKLSTWLKLLKDFKA